MFLEFIFVFFSILFSGVPLVNSESWIRVAKNAPFKYKPSIIHNSDTGRVEIEVAEPVNGVSTNHFDNFSVANGTAPQIFNPHNAHTIEFVVEGGGLINLDDWHGINFDNAEQWKNATLIFSNNNEIGLSNCTANVDIQFICAMKPANKDWRSRIVIYGLGFQALGSLTAHAPAVYITSPTLVGNDFRQKGNYLLTYDVGSISAGNNITINSERVHIESALVATDIDIQGNDYIVNFELVHGTNSVSLRCKERLTNQGWIIGPTVSIDSDFFSNKPETGKSCGVASRPLNVTALDESTERKLEISTRVLENKGILSSEGPIKLNIASRDGKTSSATNHGVIQAKRQIDMASDGGLNNLQGRIVVDGDVVFDGMDGHKMPFIDNASGEIIANGKATIRSNSFTNRREQFELRFGDWQWREVDVLLPEYHPNKIGEPLVSHELKPSSIAGGYGYFPAYEKSRIQEMAHQSPAAVVQADEIVFDTDDWENNVSTVSANKPIHFLGSPKIRDISASRIRESVIYPRDIYKMVGAFSSVGSGIACGVNPFCAIIEGSAMAAAPNEWSGGFKMLDRTGARHEFYYVEGNHGPQFAGKKQSWHASERRCKPTEFYNNWRQSHYEAVCQRDSVPVPSVIKSKEKVTGYARELHVMRTTTEQMSGPGIIVGGPFGVFLNLDFCTMRGGRVVQTGNSKWCERYEQPTDVEVPPQRKPEQIRPDEQLISIADALHAQSSRLYVVRVNAIPEVKAAIASDGLVPVDRYIYELVLGKQLLEPQCTGQLVRALGYLPKEQGLVVVAEPELEHMAIAHTLQDVMGVYDFTVADLYRNALEVLPALGLAFGQEPSDEQLRKLQANKPFVLPVIYQIPDFDLPLITVKVILDPVTLSQSKARHGSIIQAKVFDMTIEGDAHIQGWIEATGESLSLKAKNLFLQGAALSSAGDLSLEAQNELFLESLFGVVSTDRGEYSVMSAQASVKAAGQVNMKAGHKLQVKAAQIEGGKVRLESDGAILILSQAMYDKFKHTWNAGITGGTVGHDALVHATTGIKSTSGNVEIAGQGNVHAEGLGVKSAADILVSSANGNVVITNVKNALAKSQSEYGFSGGGYGYSSEDRHDEFIVASTFESAGTTRMSAKNDLTLQSTLIDADYVDVSGKNIYLTADSATSTLATESLSLGITPNVDAGFGGVSVGAEVGAKFTSKSARDKVHAVTDLHGRKGVKLNAEENISGQGTNISADAGGKVHVKAKHTKIDAVYDEHDKSSFSFAVSGGAKVAASSGFGKLAQDACLATQIDPNHPAEAAANVGFLGVQTAFDAMSAFANPFQAGAFGTAGVETSWSSSQKRTAKVGKITAETVIFEGESATLVGTEVNADDLETNLDDFHLLAAKSTTQASGFGIQVGVDIPIPGAGIGVPTVSVGVGVSGTDNITHEQVQLNVKKSWKGRIKNWLKLVGAQVTAANLDVEVGQLWLESVQDQVNEWSASASVSFGDPSESLSKLVSAVGGSIKNERKKWVEKVTSIIGTAKAKILVEKTATLIGAIVANAERNADKTFTDKGQLKFKAAQLLFEDIKDTDEGMVLQATVFNQPNQAMYASASGEVSAHGKKQTTRATLGQGDIEVGNPEVLSGINRDLSKAQEITDSFEIAPIRFYIPAINPDGTKALFDFALEGAKDPLKRLQDSLNTIRANMWFAEDDKASQYEEDLKKIFDRLKFKKKEAKDKGDKASEEFSEAGLKDVASAQAMRDAAKEILEKGGDKGIADALEAKAKQFEERAQTADDVVSGKPVNTQIPEEVAKKLGIPEELPKSPAGMRAAKLAQQMASDKAKEPAQQGQSKIDIELEQTLISAVDAMMSGDDRKAMEMADNGFNWMRLSQGFNRGVMMAVHDAAQGLTYVLKHPIDAISGLARTAWNVAEVCGPILEKFSQNVDNFDAMSSEEQNQVLEKAAADIREKAASVIQDWAALSTEEQGEIIGNALTHLGLSVGGGVAAAKVTSKIAAFAGRGTAVQAIQQIERTTGLTKGAAANVLVKQRLQHASRHLIDEGVLPNWGAKAEKQFIDLATDILENPADTFHHVLKGGNQVKGFYKNVNGKDIVVMIFEEGNLKDQIATSVVPTLEQMIKWGLK